MKKLLTLILIVRSSIGFSQIEILPEDSLKEYETAPIAVYTKDYMRKYNRMKRLIVKTYPYAIYAADLIDEIDQDAESINRRRKKNKFYKNSYKHIKEDFRYVIQDMYTSEGAMLMKLIHHETGMTIYDISLKYRGKKNAQIFNVMAKIWDQNLNAKFKPNQVEEDKIARQVLSDIHSGRIEFNDEVIIVDKLAYKEKEKRRKNQIKFNKKRSKEYKKKIRKKNRNKKRNERKNQVE